MSGAAARVAVLLAADVRRVVGVVTGVVWVVVDGIVITVHSLLLLQLVIVKLALLLRVLLRERLNRELLLLLQLYR